MSSTSTPITTGLSPRVRGNPMALRDTPDMGRSIPARAGEPPRGILTPWLLMVYPRACGGTQASYSWRMRPAGLSPRVRGNP